MQIVARVGRCRTPDSGSELKLGTVGELRSRNAPAINRKWLIQGYQKQEGLRQRRRGSARSSTPTAQRWRTLRTVSRLVDSAKPSLAGDAGLIRCYLGNPANHDGHLR